MLPLMVFLCALTLYEHSQIDLAPQYNDKHLINIEGLNLLTIKKVKKRLVKALLEQRILPEINFLIRNSKVIFGFAFSPRGFNKLLHKRLPMVY